MRATLALFMLSTVSSLALGAASAADLKLKRVFLSQGGVAYYEYAATVDGAADLNLDVPRDQIDDVMKSLVVFDDKGTVGKVSLPGDAPLAQAFRGLPFDEGSLSSLPGLLNAVRGETVTVKGPRPMTGRIVAVDMVAGTFQGATRHRLSVLTSAGIEQVYLDEAEGISFADPALTAAVNSGLNAFGAARSADTRTLKITDSGRGSREVRVGYVAAAPLWKSSYRLNMTGAGGRLQGWAILENYSGHDWDGVELTLASGNPVTFHQALYQAYFIQRPEVPVELYERILPSVDQGAVAQDVMAEMARPQAAPAPTALYRAAQSKMANLAPTEQTARISEAPTQIMFRVEKPVTLAAGQSLMLPLVDSGVPAARVAYLGVGEERMLAAVALDNKTATALPPGVLTLYETGGGGVDYLGDARMGLLPAGEERLLSFAADSKIRVGQKAETMSEVTTGKIVDGVLTATRVAKHVRAFDVATPKGEARQIMIDVAANPNWKLVAPTSGVKKTATGYRLTTDMKGGESKTIRAEFEEARAEVISLVDLSDTQIGAYVKGGVLSDNLKRALEAVAQRKHMVTEAERKLASVEQRYGDAMKEQERLRESVKSVTAADALHQRYVEKLGAVETELETLTSERKDARASLDAARAQFRSFVTSLNEAG